MQITAKWSRSIPEVELQYSYISAANEVIWTKFGLMIDFDLLQAVTSKKYETGSSI